MSGAVIAAAVLVGGGLLIFTQAVFSGTGRPTRLGQLMATIGDTDEISDLRRAELQTPFMDRVVWPAINRVGARLQRRQVGDSELATSLRLAWFGYSFTPTVILA